MHGGAGRPAWATAAASHPKDPDTCHMWARLRTEMVPCSGGSTVFPSLTKLALLLTFIVTTVQFLPSLAWGSVGCVTFVINNDFSESKNQNCLIKMKNSNVSRLQDLVVNTSLVQLCMMCPSLFLFLVFHCITSRKCSYVLDGSTLCSLLWVIKLSNCECSTNCSHVPKGGGRSPEFHTKESKKIETELKSK